MRQAYPQGTYSPYDQFDVDPEHLWDLSTALMSVTPLEVTATPKSCPASHRLRRSLEYRDWARAKRQADEFAAGFVGPDLNGEAEPEPLTLGRLFDVYGEEVTPTKWKRTRERDRVATAMFLRFFGGTAAGAGPRPSPAAHLPFLDERRPPQDHLVVVTQIGVRVLCVSIRH